MVQKTFLPKKPFFKSKINWLFLLVGALTTPEGKNFINSIGGEMLLPAISFAGIVIRTFFTNHILTIKEK